MDLVQLSLTFILFTLPFFYSIVKEEMIINVELNMVLTGKSTARLLNIESFQVKKKKKKKVKRETKLLLPQEFIELCNLKVLFLSFFKK